MLHRKNYLRRKLVLFLVIAGLLVAGGQVWADEKPQESAELEEFFTLVERETADITTGTSRPMQKSKVPASISVITADELKLLGLRHLTDVINYIVPGAVGDIHRSTRTGLYAFRGISVDNNGKYVFMVDGLNAGNLTQWGAFNERYLGLMDELKQIEIIQGTGSILYGSGAISGVINFITKTGKDVQGHEITAGYGSWDKVETSYKFGEKPSEDEESFYYFGFKRSGGTTPEGGEGTPAISRAEHSRYGRYWDHFDNSGKFHANIRRGDFTLRMRYVRDRFEEPYRSGYNSSGVWNGGIVDTSDIFWIEDYFFIQPEITHKISEVSRIKANISFMMNESGMEKNDSWPAGGLTDGERVKTAGERKLRGQLFHYYDGFENHKLTSGLELFWMHAGPDFKGRNYYIKPGTKYRLMKPDNLYFAAGFFEDIWKISDKTTIFGGVLAEYHNKTQLMVSPRIALSHDVSEKTNWKLLYNRGFRTPDQVYYSTNIDNETSRPRPERVDSFEGHLIHKFSPNFDFTTVAYYTIYKDLINYFGTGYNNFSTIRAAGLEFGGDYHKDNLKLKFSHSFSKPVHIGQDNYDDVDLSYDRRNWALFPTHMTKAQMIYHFIKDKCMLGVTYFRPWGIKGQYNATTNLKKAADYLNATLTYRLSEDFEVQFSGYNLTGEDHPWWGAGTSDGVSRSINPHREWFVRMIWKF